MFCLQAKKWQEVPPKHQYPLLFQHSAIPEDPTLMSKVLLNQSDITSSGSWDNSLLNDASVPVNVQ
jgi:hypothetical protein